MMGKIPEVSSLHLGNSTFGAGKCHMKKMFKKMLNSCTVVPMRPDGDKDSLVFKKKKIAMKNMGKKNKIDLLNN